MTPETDKLETEASRVTELLRSEKTAESGEVAATKLLQELLDAENSGDTQKRRRAARLITAITSELQSAKRNWDIDTTGWVEAATKNDHSEQTWKSLLPGAKYGYLELGVVPEMAKRAANLGYPYPQALLLLEKESAGRSYDGVYGLSEVENLYYPNLHAWHGEAAKAYAWRIAQLDEKQRRVVGMLIENWGGTVEELIAAAGDMIDAETPRRGEEERIIASWREATGEGEKTFLEYVDSEVTLELEECEETPDHAEITDLLLAVETAGSRLRAAWKHQRDWDPTGEEVTDLLKKWLTKLEEKLEASGRAYNPFIAFRIAGAVHNLSYLRILKEKDTDKQRNEKLFPQIPETAAGRALFICWAKNNPDMLTWHAEKDPENWAAFLETLTPEQAVEWRGLVEEELEEKRIRAGGTPRKTSKQEEALKGAWKL